MIYMEQSKYMDAELYFIKAQEAFIHINDSLGIANNQNSLGELARNRGNYPEAITNTLNHSRLDSY